MVVVTLYSRKARGAQEYALWSKEPMHTLGHHYSIEAAELIGKAFGVNVPGYPEKLPPFVKESVDWHPFSVDLSNTLASFERLTSSSGSFNSKECLLEPLEKTDFASFLEGG